MYYWPILILFILYDFTCSITPLLSIWKVKLWIVSASVIKPSAVISIWLLPDIVCWVIPVCCISGITFVPSISSVDTSIASSHSVGVSKHIVQVGLEHLVHIICYFMSLLNRQNKVQPKSLHSWEKITIPNMDITGKMWPIFDLMSFQVIVKQVFKQDSIPFACVSKGLFCFYETIQTKAILVTSQGHTINHTMSMQSECCGCFCSHFPVASPWLSSHPFCWLLRVDWYLYRQRLLSNDKAN